MHCVDVGQACLTDTCTLESPLLGGSACVVDFFEVRPQLGVAPVQARPLLFRLAGPFSSRRDRHGSCNAFEGLDAGAGIRPFP
eukprot:6464779-Amphidinium_carterae.1